MENVIYEATGVVHAIGNQFKNETGTFEKTPLILLVSSSFNGTKYEDFIEFDFINEGQHLIAPIFPGNKITVRFVLNGRLGKDKYEGRAFTTLKGIKVEVLEASTPQQAQQGLNQSQEESATNNFVMQSSPASSGADDLPF